MLEVDAHGFDELDRRLLRTIIEKYDGGPVGLNTLAAALAEEQDALEEVYEPFLIQIGFLDRTPRGRVATKLAYEHLGIEMPRPSFVWNLPYAPTVAGRISSTSTHCRRDNRRCSTPCRSWPGRQPGRRLAFGARVRQPDQRQRYASESASMNSRISSMRFVRCDQVLLAEGVSTP
jgi:hypothetical protein